MEKYLKINVPYEMTSMHVNIYMNDPYIIDGSGNMAAMAKMTLTKQLIIREYIVNFLNITLCL